MLGVLCCFTSLSNTNSHIGLLAFGIGLICKKIISVGFWDYFFVHRRYSKHLDNNEVFLKPAKKAVDRSK
jgi:hypothetical protein